MSIVYTAVVKKRTTVLVDSAEEKLRNLTLNFLRLHGDVLNSEISSYIKKEFKFHFLHEEQDILFICVSLFSSEEKSVNSVYKLVNYFDSTQSKTHPLLDSYALDDNSYIIYLEVIKDKFCNMFSGKEDRENVNEGLSNFKNYIITTIEDFNSKFKPVSNITIKSNEKSKEKEEIENENTLEEDLKNDERKFTIGTVNHKLSHIITERKKVKVFISIMISILVLILLLSILYLLLLVLK